MIKWINLRKEEALHYLHMDKLFAFSFRLQNLWLHTHQIPEERIHNIEILKRELTETNLKNEIWYAPPEFCERIKDFTAFLIHFTTHEIHWEERKHHIRYLLDCPTQLITAMCSPNDLNGNPYTDGVKAYVHTIRKPYENEINQIQMPPHPLAETTDGKCLLCDIQTPRLQQALGRRKEEFLPPKHPPLPHPRNSMGPHIFATEINCENPISDESL